MIPKYRAWDKEESIIRTVSALSFEHEKVFCKFAEFEPFDLGEELPFERIVLMQSTGLKDKNDIEIFEGDIVHYQSPTMAKNDWYQKIARRGPALVMMSFDERGIDSAEFFNLMSRDKRLEVIGNIYENPELLERDT